MSETILERTSDSHYANLSALMFLEHYETGKNIVKSKNVKKIVISTPRFIVEWSRSFLFLSVW